MEESQEEVVAMGTVAGRLFARLETDGNCTGPSVMDHLVVRPLIHTQFLHAWPISRAGSLQTCLKGFILCIWLCFEKDCLCRKLFHRIFC